MVLAECFLAECARPPTEVRLHVTEDEIESGGGFIESAGCVGVSAETSRRLACDAAVVEVVEDAAGRALRTGRRTRSVPARIRRSLEVPYQPCDGEREMLPLLGTECLFLGPRIPGDYGTGDEQPHEG